MTEVMQTSKVLAALDNGNVSFSDLLKTVAVRENVVGNIPVDLPKQVVVTAAQSAALRDAEMIVGSGVTPTERRRLSQEELLSLMEERETLDAIAKMIEDRREAQRAAIFNHFDVEAEAAGIVGERDKGASAGKGRGRSCFCWQEVHSRGAPFRSLIGCRRSCLLGR